MKKIFEWLKANLGIIKTIFLISVVSIIIRELMLMSQTFSYAKIMETMGQIPLWKIGLMLVIGLVAVFPMVGYDYLLTTFIPQLRQSGFSQADVDVMLRENPSQFFQ